MVAAELDKGEMGSCLMTVEFVLLSEKRSELDGGDGCTTCNVLKPLAV
jgi:hypothetical protein